MRYRPRFDYDTGPTILQLTISQRPWNVSAPTIGGAERAASGVGAAYLVTEYEFLDIVPRFYEAEWPSVRSFVRFAQALPNTFLFYPDRDLTTSFLCDLESPRMGEDLKPIREPFGQGDFVYRLPLIIRKVDGTPWDIVYHDQF